MLFLRYSLLAQWKEHYPKKWYILHSIVSASLALWVYKMTSKAIGSGIMADRSWEGMDYFSFVVIGELALLFPLSCLEAVSRGVRYAHFSGFLDTILLQSLSPWKKLFGISLGTLLREIIDFLIQIILAILIFDLSLNSAQVVSYLFHMFLSLPNFFMFGAIVGLVILVTGRGGGIVGQAMFLLSVLSGVFFPTTVFPQWVQDYVVDFLPTAHITASIRGGELQFFSNLLVWGICFLFLAVSFRYLSSLSLKLRQSQDRVDVPLN